MRSWVKKKLGRLHGHGATRDTNDSKRRQQAVAPQPRDASSTFGGWCWRCRAVDPQQWFCVSTPQSEPWAWTADNCNTICEVRDIVQKLVTDPVTFSCWIHATHNDSNRHKWIKSQPCFEPPCIVCEDQLSMKFVLLECCTLTLLDHLDESVATAKAKSLRTPGSWSADLTKVNLKALRENHAPDWMKTVTFTPHDHGGWRSVSIRSATCRSNSSEPVEPGRISTQRQRVLVPASTGGSIAGQGRRLGQRYDPEIIKLWLTTCSTRHLTTCHPGQAAATVIPFPDNLKLIDVHNLCIVSLPPADESNYVALSYVWGSGGQPTLTKANLGLWSTAGVLGQHLDLPQTIRDAIKVVQDIGMRFLWVDALCNVQDDRHELALQIQQMDRIYSRATLTIAATTGEVRYGLHGVSREWTVRHMSDDEHREIVHLPLPYPPDVSRYFYDSTEEEPTPLPYLRECQIRGLTLIEVLENPEAALEDSIWRQRGWTFQEELCSNAIVYFLPSNMLFRCGEAIWRADVVLEDLPSSLGDMTASGRQDDHRQQVRSLIRQPNTMDRHGFVNMFRKLVHGYMMRRLTKPDDIEKAFAGVANALQRSIGPLYRGIPQWIFGEIIEGCWYWDVLLERRKGFPSWSWTGWVKTLKDPEIGIAPARAYTGDAPLLKFFSFARGKLPKPLFEIDASLTGSSTGIFRHFDVDEDELQRRHKKHSGSGSPPTGDCIAFPTSLAFLSIRSASRVFYEPKLEESFTVYCPGAGNKKLTSIRLLVKSYPVQAGERYPFIVTSKSERGFQLMMVEFVDGVAYKVNVTAPGEPVKVEDWMGVGASKSLIVMG